MKPRRDYTEDRTHLFVIIGIGLASTRTQPESVDPNLYKSLRKSAKIGHFLDP